MTNNTHRTYFYKSHTHTNHYCTFHGGRAKIGWQISKHFPGWKTQNHRQNKPQNVPCTTTKHLHQLSIVWTFVLQSTVNTWTDNNTKLNPPLTKNNNNLNNKIWMNTSHAGMHTHTHTHTHTHRTHTQNTHTKTHRPEVISVQSQPVDTARALMKIVKKAKTMD